MFLHVCVEGCFAPLSRIKNHARKRGCNSIYLLFRLGCWGLLRPVFGYADEPLCGREVSAPFCEREETAPFCGRDDCCPSRKK